MAETLQMRNNVHNQLIEYGMRGGALALTALAFGGAAESASADVAPVAPVQPTVMSAAELPSTVTATFKTETSTAHVKVTDVATSNVTVLENFKANGIPAKQHAKLEKIKGNCKTFDGNKIEIDTAGHNTSGMTEYGRDHRTSRFCQIAGRWIRVKCGNPAYIKVKPPVPVAQHPLYVKTFSKAKVSLTAEATAKAECAVGGASASAYGHGRATEKADLRTFIRTSKMKNMGANSIAIKTYVKASGKASAAAEATANCHSEAATVTIVTAEKPPVVTPPVVCAEGTNFDDKNHNGKIDNDECVVPKDGTQGPGAGTPGNTSTGSTVGGTLPAGQPGNPDLGKFCSDDNSTVNGDMLATTSGATMTVGANGTRDINWNCIGQADAITA